MRSGAYIKIACRNVIATHSFHSSSSLNPLPSTPLLQFVTFSSLPLTHDSQVDKAPDGGREVHVINSKHFAPSAWLADCHSSPCPSHLLLFGRKELRVW